jgi:serine/threonine protein kinase
MLLGEQDSVLLSDFGLVTLLAHTSPYSTQNIEPSVRGTLPYVAPEQIQGQPRPASDQYALGVVVYEWLCGRPLFTAR